VENDDRPPEGPPNIDVSSNVKLPASHWDLVSGRLKIILRR